MRKTRLVILPTKCLHQMGFLLLFLSCPVIGDWGRIQPESATSHEAIQIERKGTCAMKREPSEGLLDVLSSNGSNQCRLSEFYDSTDPKENSVVREYNFEKSSETRRILSQRNLNRNQRILSERRVNGEQRREREVRRDVRRVTRSRSVESRRMSASRNSLLERQTRDTRSQSLNSLERTEARIQRQPENERLSQRRLSLARQQNERSGRRIEHQVRLNRETRTERRENERTMRRSERREERVNDGRMSRRSSHRQNGQRDSRRETEREQRLNSERRLSLARMERNEDTRKGRETSRRQDNLQRRIIAQNRVVRSVDARRDVRDTEKGKLNARMERSVENQSGIESRRFSLTGKPLERRNVRVESRDLPMDKMEARRNMRDARIDATRKPIGNLDLGNKADNTNLFEGIITWMTLKNYDTFKIGDWTTNCIIGAVAYFVTARQVKSV